MLAAVRDTRAEGRDATITVVMRRSNLSYVRMARLLTQLVSSGLLDEIGDRQYALSERGSQYLRFYSQFDEFAQSYGLKI